MNLESQIPQKESDILTRLESVSFLPLDGKNDTEKMLVFEKGKEEKR